MPVTIVVGGQYGSEAKGKVVQYLANEFDAAIRTGSVNAGHTVVTKTKTYKMQQIPATFLNKKCQLYIGAGGLISPEILAKEIEITNTKNRVFVDYNAGVIEKNHRLAESNLVKNISSTGKGCGAALIDRIWRKDFKLAKDCFSKDYKLSNVSKIINKKLENGEKVLLEGTQGFGLSIYHGEYPYVTSRDTTAASFLSESGISPLWVDDIILVIRTYPIRVSGKSGPLKNEISWDDLSKRIGKNVIEKTTVSRKIRRVAEFDIELVKQAIEVNKPTQIALQFLNYKFPQDYNKSSWEDLSVAAKKYIKELETQIKIPITLIGTSEYEEGMIDLRKNKH